jgi:hypothetical protein
MDLSTVVYVLGAVLYALWSRRSNPSTQQAPSPPVWTPPSPSPPVKASNPSAQMPNNRIQAPKTGPAIQSTTRIQPSEPDALEKPGSDLRPKTTEDWKKAVIWSSLLDPRFEKPYRGPTGV